MGKSEQFDVMAPFRKIISDAKQYSDLPDEVIRIHGDPIDAAELAEFYASEVYDTTTPEVVREEWHLMISRAARETLPHCSFIDQSPRPALFGLPALQVWMEAIAIGFAKKKLKGIS